MQIRKPFDSELFFLECLQFNFFSVLTYRVQRAVGITEIQIRQRISIGQEPEEKLQDRQTHKRKKQKNNTFDSDSEET